MPTTLKICEKPQCMELHTSAFPLSILNADDHFSDKWIIQNLIPVVFAKRFGDILTYDMPLFWFWDCFQFQISFHYPGKNVIKTIKNKIDEGFYVFLCVNEKYIPERKAYQSYNYRHEILIYGYDENKKIFQTIAYNKNEVYVPQEINMDTIKIAFLKNKSEHFFKFYPIKIKPFYIFDTLNIEKIRKDIADFLSPRKANKGYNALLLVEKKVRNEIRLYGHINLRCLRTIRDRAENFYIFQKYFDCDQELKTLMENNKTVASNLMMLVLKYNILQSPNLYQHILEKLRQQREMEKEILKRLDSVCRTSCADSKILLKK